MVNYREQHSPDILQSRLKQQQFSIEATVNRFMEENNLRAYEEMVMFLPHPDDFYNLAEFVRVSGLRWNIVGVMCASEAFVRDMRVISDRFPNCRVTILPFHEILFFKEMSPQKEVIRLWNTTHPESQFASESMDDVEKTYKSISISYLFEVYNPGLWNKYVDQMTKLSDSGPTFCPVGCCHPSHRVVRSVFDTNGFFSAVPEQKLSICYYTDLPYCSYKYAREEFSKKTTGMRSVEFTIGRETNNRLAAEFVDMFPFQAGSSQLVLSGKGFINGVWTNDAFVEQLWKPAVS